MSEAAAVPREHIRQELARILRDPDFQANPRGQAFLTHIVGKVLHGR